MNKEQVLETVIWILVLGAPICYFIYACLFPEENKHYPILEGKGLKKVVSGTKDWQPNKVTGELEKAKQAPRWVFLRRPWEDVAKFEVKIYFVGTKDKLPPGAVIEWEFSNSTTVLYYLKEKTDHIRGYAYYFFIVRGVETSGYREAKGSEEAPENVTLDFVFGGWVRTTSPEKAYKKGDYLTYLYQQVQAFLYEQLKLFSYADISQITLEEPPTIDAVKKGATERAKHGSHHMGEKWKKALNRRLTAAIGQYLEDLNLHDHTFDEKSKEFDDALTRQATARVNRETAKINAEGTRATLKPIEESYEAFNETARKTKKVPTGDATVIGKAIETAKPKIMNVSVGASGGTTGGEMNFEKFMQLTEGLLGYKMSGIEKDVLGKEAAEPTKSEGGKKHWKGKK